MVPRKLLGLLVVLAVALPAAICVLLAVGRLLAAMGDAAAAAVLDRLVLAGGVLWLLGLLGLLLAVALTLLIAPHDPQDRHDTDRP